jgi:hypothetical protein
MRGALAAVWSLVSDFSGPAALVHARGRLPAWPGSTIQGMAFDELLADRVRTCLQQAAGVSEKKMFGGLAFLTGGHLTVGVYGDGLIARIGAQDMDAATAEPGVRYRFADALSPGPRRLQAPRSDRRAGVSDRSRPA